ncbi:Putative s-adenosyl-L-methionine-dependent methyltransferase (fragment) [Avibacterium paragallinarum JF4211]|uniref:Type III restriction system methylase n=3 Tax=Avibacterium paragallinarum TaxID=728 RepID=A0A377I973_AVIPA
MEKLTKSKARVRAFGEVYTPQKLVQKMTALLPEESFEPEKKILEPSCGTGNFLYDILNRKLCKILVGPKRPYYKVLNMYQALASVYGVDIQLDNVIECQSRLKSLFYERLAMLHVKPFDYFVDHVLINNIRRGNALEDAFIFIDVEIVFKDRDIGIKVEKDSFLLSEYECHLQQNTSQLQAVRLLAFEDEIGISRNTQ